MGLLLGNGEQHIFHDLCPHGVLDGFRRWGGKGLGRNGSSHELGLFQRNHFPFCQLSAQDLGGLGFCDHALVRYFKERKARQEKKDVPSEEEP